MSAATLAMDLRELSPAELTELDAAVPGLYSDDIAAERRRRKNAAQIARRRAGPVEQAWIDAAHAQMMQAEAELAGKLVRQGSPIADAWSLWSGSAIFADAHCTDDLRRWWELPGNRRMTLTEYKAQERHARRIYEEGMRDDTVESDGPADVRCGPGSESPAASDRSCGDTVPGGSAGTETQERASAGRGSAGDTGHVRRPGLLTIDDTDPEGSRVILRRDGLEIGRAQRIQVKVKGELWPAWWAIADGAAIALRRDKRDAVAAIPR